MSPDSTTELGRRGEDLACRHLEAQGLRLLETDEGDAVVCLGRVVEREDEKDNGTETNAAPGQSVRPISRWITSGC